MHRWTLAMVVAGIAVGMCSASVTARAENGAGEIGAAEIGANVGVAVPLKGYSHTVEGVGGTVGMDAGYRFFLTDNVALSLVGNPQVSIFGTEEGCCRGPGDSDDIGVVGSLTAGPKLTFGADPVEFYVGGQGGWFWDLSRPIKDDGPGYVILSGLDFNLDRSNVLGFYGRYDVAYMTGRPESGDTQRKWVSGGFAWTHLFLPEEVVAAPPPPPPPPPPPVRQPPPPPPPTQRRGG